jgi:hypothetical protein
MQSSGKKKVRLEKSRDFNRKEERPESRTGAKGLNGV